MSDETVIPAAKPRSLDAFLPAEEQSDAHIVDVLIEERCPKLRGSPAWPVARPLLYSILGYGKARAMADELVQLTGRESFDRLSRQLSFDMTVAGLDRLPETGRCIVAANHPTGLADGVAVWDLLKKKREDIVFFANADAVRVNPRFEDVIIPVEWVVAKRSPAKARETLKRAAEAFAQEKCVVIFPSGRLARKVDGQMEEKEWFPTVVGLARKQAAPVVPLNLDARNSALYYLFCDLSDELRDITLFHELLNKRGSKIRMTFGEAIHPDRLQGEPAAVTERLKQHVAYALLANPDAVFTA
ncbi:MAG: acyltransferase [Hyphomonas sp.]|uniref:GNAT family N-acetyltransferase n=1 Tax=Hyphomonas sp. TaxID=87 RepID=UPI0017DD7BFA|nr:1-acyl-sn-glycerol-3-phosphate acyltransferase [Hyphomonas sp.]MBA3068489.1 acyltransferase [Hyphomonas sp.]MBU3919286.1 1-acyl-sn-glycerol-3-phosphate acyltransferase [Alphaproteobacteria bacterium]MBU4060644.1 1-acyl-sn-glycerol-3-phosphate acyltransferase [Alphaproteobacteria bacterium]MBU4164628.1 1-acyl-sn-glycerol-3-phosphate acyltransferase [Alphaproteobacteria bacterium]